MQISCVQIKEDKYIFIYGGTDIGGTQRIGTLLDSIKKDPILKQADAIIEHFNLSRIDQTSVTNFWNNITNSMLNLVVQKLKLEQEDVLKDIETLLSFRTQKTWVILSKGNNVRIKVSLDTMITKILEDFDEWKGNVIQGFDEAFIRYHDEITEGVPPPCVRFQVNNIRSGVPFTITCPEPSCKKLMEVESVSYKCCHGIHSHHAAASEIVNGEIGTPILKTKWTP